MKETLQALKTSFQLIILWICRLLMAHSPRTTNVVGRCTLHPGWIVSSCQTMLFILGGIFILPYFPSQARIIGPSSCSGLVRERIATDHSDSNHFGFPMLVSKTLSPRNGAPLIQQMAQKCSNSNKNSGILNSLSNTGIKLTLAIYSTTKGSTSFK